MQKKLVEFSSSSLLTNCIILPYLHQRSKHNLILGWQTSDNGMLIDSLHIIFLLVRKLIEPREEIPYTLSMDHQFT